MGCRDTRQAFTRFTRTRTAQRAASKWKYQAAKAGCIRRRWKGGGGHKNKGRRGNGEWVVSPVLGRKSGSLTKNREKKDNKLLGKPASG